MPGERAHAPEDASAELGTEATPSIAPDLLSLIGNRGTQSLVQRAPAGVPVLPPSNRGRARILSRVPDLEETYRIAPDRYEPKGSDLRDAILADAAAVVPATEGEAKFYLGVSQATIEEGRRNTPAGRTYTDCIDFAANRVKAGLWKVKKKATVPSPVFPDQSPAFVRAWKDMEQTRRPSPGDIFIMHSGTPDDATADSGNFAHTGVIKEIQPSGGGAEQWTSYDGGQGSPTKLEHLEKTRSYDPKTNIFGGKVLYGWIDVDAL